MRIGFAICEPACAAFRNSLCLLLRRHLPRARAHVSYVCRTLHYARRHVPYSAQHCDPDHVGLCGMYVGICLLYLGTCRINVGICRSAPAVPDGMSELAVCTSRRILP